MKKLKNRIFKNMALSVLASVLAVSAVLSACILFKLNTAITVIALISVTAICVIAVYYISSGLTERIVKPINDIDLNDDNQLSVYEELKPFSKKLTVKNKKLKKQMQRIKKENKLQEKSRQEFTANVSHELKTPLTSISGYAEILKNGMVKDEDIIRFSEKIYNETQRLITLVGDIIKLSRLDENAIEKQKDEIELYSLCKANILRLESSAKKKSVEFCLSGERAVINGIERIIDEMVYNLLDNAIKYNKDGGKVKINVSNLKNEVVLSVSDNGIGIAENDINRIFERFYRVNKSHSREIGGTGLGLSIVKHGAAVHNARLNVDSVLGEGTTFTLIFPV